jgi:5-methylthioadenosine/S-adenosylhomocysteine deaminase
MDEVAEIADRTGKRPVDYINDLGLMQGKLIAAHVVHIDEREMELLSEKEMKVVHLPESNMKLASGISPVKKMIDKGISVGLGTDGCSSNNDLDMFLEMDTAAKVSKILELDPVALDAGTVMKMATLWGAGFLGNQECRGTIEKGKKADIIVVDLKKPHLCPVYDPISLMVYSASGADVRDVIVDGRILMKNRKFMTLDHHEIMAKVNEICSSFT